MRRRNSHLGRQDKKPFPFRIRPQLPNVIAAEFAAAAALGIMYRLHVQWPWMVAVAVSITLIAVVEFKDALLPRWLVIWWRWWRSRKSDPTAAVDDRGLLEVELPRDNDRDLSVAPQQQPRYAGMRWDNDVLVAVIAMWSNAHVPTVIAHDPNDPHHEGSRQPWLADMVPLDVVAEGLKLRAGLEAIDVIQVGRRTTDGTAYSALYDQIIGLDPALVAKRTWLILRLPFDPANPEIVRRGGGLEGAVLAMRDTARHLTRRLREVSCNAEIADPDEFLLAEASLMTGIPQDGEGIESHRGGIVTPRGHITTYRLHPDDLTNRHLGIWWAYRSSEASGTYRATTSALILRLTPARDRESVGVRAWVRYHTTEAPGKDARLPRLVRQYADQGAALTATLPLGNQSLRAQKQMVTAPLAFRTPGELRELRLPVGPSGQLMGRTGSGDNMLLPLAERGLVTRVYVDGPLWIAQQLVLRSLASGSSCRVSSSRPEQWWPMMRRLAEDHRLWLAPDPEPRFASMQVCDLTPATFPAGAVTVLIVGRPGADPPADIDILVKADPRDPYQVTVTTASMSKPMPIGLTEAREEARYIGHSNDVRQS